MNPREYYEHIINTMPEGIERRIIYIMRNYIGKEKSIEKGRLVIMLKAHGFFKDAAFSTAERQLRYAIGEINNDPNQKVIIIGSTGNGGYYLPANPEECSVYIATERSRADEVNNKLKSIENKASEIFELVTTPATAEVELQPCLF